MLQPILIFSLAFWVPIIYLFFPETKGLELEDVDRLFAKDQNDVERIADARGSHANELSSDEDKMTGNVGSEKA